MTMLIASGLQIVGLLLTVRGSWILLRGLFITNEEIDELSNLPVRESKRYVQGGDCLAAIDPEELKHYRCLYLKKRKAERRSGKIALRLFIVGFALQAVGLFLAALPNLQAWLCSST